MVFEYKVDDDGLHLLMAKEVWTALMALHGTEVFGDPDLPLVKVSFASFEESLLAEGSPSHLNPPCPPFHGI
jgi:hypothetical protein